MYKLVREMVIPISLAVLASSAVAWAAPGDLDTSFGNQGTTTSTFGSDVPVPAAIVRGSSEKLYVLVNLTSSGTIGSLPSRFAILRYSVDGALDSSFGNGGRLSLTSSTTIYQGLAVDEANQKLLLSGLGSDLQATVSRIGFDGTADPAFGSQGDAQIKAETLSDGDLLEPLADGSVIVAGTTHGSSGAGLFVSHLQANGALDTSFGNKGITNPVPVSGRTADFASLASDASGKILLCGPTSSDTSSSSTSITPSGVVITRLSATGAPDTSFGANGSREVDFGFRAACLTLRPQSSGEFAVAALAGATLSVALIQSNGTLDTVFNGNGLQSSPLGVSWLKLTDAVAQSDGKLVVVGLTGTNTMGLARLQGSPELADATGASGGGSSGGGSGDSSGSGSGGGSGSGSFDWLALATLAGLGLWRRRPGRDAANLGADSD